jgi:hypothetical protein
MKTESYPGAQRIEHWPIETLIPYAQNPRTHSDAQVARSNRLSLRISKRASQSWNAPPRNQGGENRRGDAVLKVCDAGEVDSPYARIVDAQNADDEIADVA